MTTRRNLLTTAAATLLASRAFAHVGKDERKPSPGAPLKIGLASYSYRQYLQGAKKTMSLFDFIAKAAEIGADGVELTEYYFEKPITSEYLNRLKRTCHLWGQSISCAGTSSTFTYPAGAMRDQQVGNAKKWLDVAAELGAPVIRVFAGASPKGMSESEARKNVIECLDQVCEHAGTRGVLVAMENHHGVVATSEGVLEILNGVQSPWFGLNLWTSATSAPPTPTPTSPAAPLTP
jgi:sugar phosphate isomerase/epimerase